MNDVPGIVGEVYVNLIRKDDNKNEFTTERI